MEESNEGPSVVPELYFLIAKFLSGGPLKETAKTLLKELGRVEVLPRRLDWEGTEHAQSYDELESQYADMPSNRLAAVCQQFLKNHSLPTTAERALSLSARLSLLSDALVRPKPKYSAYKEDHSLVRRLCSRELGRGGAGTVGGRGGVALMSPRMLSGLQLQRRTLGHLSAVYCVVFDRTGRYVLTGADDLLIKVWSAIDGRLLATLRGAGAEITDADVSRDGALLAAGSVERLVRVWCLATGAPKAVLHAHQGTITSVRWAPPASPDVRWLASTSTDGSVAFWTCSADGQFLSQPVQYVERMRPGACHMICAAWSAGGGFLAAGSADHHVRVYMVSGGAPRRVLEVAVHADAVDSIAWAHRGLRLVSGSKDGTAALWTLHATQWRHTLLRTAPIDNHDNAHDKRLKVTMVCWDCSDAFILTAVSDKTLRVWCARSCTQTRVLSGHRDEAYVLEAHPTLPGVVLSAGHDGQLLVWEAARGELLASFHNDITGQGDGAIFDAKWGGLTSIAATDSHGHLLLLGLGQGHRLLQDLPRELFFHTDYRPLVRDALGGALDEQTETPPHLMAPPFLVDVEGAPHEPRYQRLVPGREHLARDQLIPANEPQRRLDLMIEALAANGTPPDEARGGGVWRGEGVRHTAGSWQSGDPPPHCERTIVQPLPRQAVRCIEKQCEEMNGLEQAWYRREMRRRPLMISTAPEQGRRRRPGRRAAPAAPPRARPNPPQRPPYVSPTRSIGSYSSYSPDGLDISGSDHSSHSSNERGGRVQRAPRPRAHARATYAHRDSDSLHTDSCSYTSGKTEDSSESSYSDWEAGEEMAPPARARRRPLPARRYSPSAEPSKRPSRPASPASPGAPPPPPAPLPEAYRPGEWLCAVSPRKAPYHPQMGDQCLYFRLGHQRYFEAVAEKDVYKVNPRDKPWERTQINECELVKVVGVKYVIKPPRIVCLRLACLSSPAPRQRIFTVKYHDMPDVIDFLVLKQQYDVATQRHWGHGDRFRCMIDDSWWTGVVLESTAPVANGAGTSTANEWAARAASHFLSLKVRWDNGEVERLSPWDLEPLDPERLPAEPGGSVGVLPHELEAVLYRAEPEEWPPRGDRAAACRAIAIHVSQVMTLSVAEPFVAPVDLQLYPSYAMVVPYPIDLATIRARFENLFYRRTVAAQFDVRYLASNAEQFNQPHSPIVRQARLVTDLLLHIISEWRDVDVLDKYHELAASYHSSDDEPLANHASKSNRSRRQKKPAVDWRKKCSEVLKELMRSPDAEPFKQPVSLEQAPDYLLVVPDPIDLGSVATKLQNGRYARASRFADDVRRVFANSRLYNTNKRSRIYSMTVRLSALFESLWSRAALPGDSLPTRRPRRAAATRRRPRARVERPEEDEAQENGASHSSSDSETLAVTSRRVHSDHHPAPHSKGKGVGKKSASSTQPEPGTSYAHEEHEEFLRVPEGLTSSSDEALAAIRVSHTQDTDQEAPDDHIYTKQSVRKRRRAPTSGSSASDKRTRRKRTAHTRTRERFTGDSSSSSSSSSSGLSDAMARRYESDRSYKPRYSTDDDAPLLLYRQRQEPAEPGPSAARVAGGSGTSHSTRRGAPHASTSGGVSLRARRSPRRYNEDSEEDSVACISKRLPHHHHRRQRQLQLSTRSTHHAAQVTMYRYNEDSEEDSVACISKRLPHHHHRRQRQLQLSTRSTHHAAQTASGPSRAGGPSGASGPSAHTDHNYYNGAHSDHAQHNGGRSSNPAEEEARPALSISSRGRVRKLTAKARGLLH